MSEIAQRDFTNEEEKEIFRISRRSNADMINFLCDHGDDIVTSKYNTDFILLSICRITSVYIIFAFYKYGGEGNFRFL